jgi:hypothetical protein
MGHKGSPLQSHLWASYLFLVTHSVLGVIGVVIPATPLLHMYVSTAVQLHVAKHDQVVRVALAIGQSRRDGHSCVPCV